MELNPYRMFTLGKPTPDNPGIAARTSLETILEITWAIDLNLLDYYPQAHGSIVAAFHPEVFRVSLFIFSQRKALEY